MPTRATAYCHDVQLTQAIERFWHAPRPTSKGFALAPLPTNSAGGDRSGAPPSAKELKLFAAMADSSTTRRNGRAPPKTQQSPALAEILSGSAPDSRFARVSPSPRDSAPVQLNVLEQQLAARKEDLDRREREIKEQEQTAMERESETHSACNSPCWQQATQKLHSASPIQRQVMVVPSPPPCCPQRKKGSSPRFRKKRLASAGRPEVPPSSHAENVWQRKGTAPKANNLVRVGAPPPISLSLSMSATHGTSRIGVKGAAGCYGTASMNSTAASSVGFERSGCMHSSGGFETSQRSLQTGGSFSFSQSSFRAPRANTASSMVATSSTRRVGVAGAPPEMVSRESPRSNHRVSNSPEQRRPLVCRSPPCAAVDTLRSPSSSHSTRMSPKKTQTGLDLAALASVGQIRELREIIRSELNGCDSLTSLECAQQTGEAVLREGSPRGSVPGGLAEALRNALWRHEAGVPRDVRQCFLKKVLNQEMTRRKVSLEAEISGRSASADEHLIKERARSSNSSPPMHTAGTTKAATFGAVVTAATGLQVGSMEVELSNTLSEIENDKGELRQPLQSQHRETNGCASFPLASFQQHSTMKLNRSSTSNNLSPRKGSSETVSKKPLNPEAKRELPWRAAYCKFVNCGRIRRDDLKDALVLAGFTQPVEGYIADVFDAQWTTSTLTQDSFLVFVRGYEECQRRAYAEAFHRCDIDGSGTIEAFELAELLQGFGIEPMRHVLQEIIAEVDEDKSGELSLEEFESLMEILRTSEGFTKSEREQLMSVYERYDSDCTGQVSTEGLAGVLGYLGYTLSFEEVRSVVSEVDVDGSGALDAHEFLVCMRKVRETEVAKIKNAFDLFDVNDNCKVCIEEITALLGSLGFVPDRTALMESAEDAGLLDPDGALVELDLGGLWQLLEVFRSREGLSRWEAHEVAEAFERYDEDQDGQIATFDIGKVLRWFGYASSFDLQQHLTHLVDVDKSGQLDGSEVRKLIRMYREKEITQLQKVFDYYAKDGSSQGISLAAAAAAFRKVGCVDSHGKAPSVLPEELDRDRQVTRITFVTVALRTKRSMRDANRQNGGYTSAEVAELRKDFEKYDKDGSGDISNAELGCLIRTMFPSMGSVLRTKLNGMMKEVDANGDGKLDFEDFVRLMRQFHDIQSQEKIEKELQAIEETSFSAEEVHEFRELFLNTDVDGDLELSITEVKKMIANICPVGNNNCDVLQQAFNDVSNKQGMVDGSLDQCDFPEFLWLMRKLLDINYGNIKSNLA